jgi:protease-4
MSVRRGLTRLLQAVWRGLDTLRRVLHLFVLLFVFAVLLAGLAGPPVRVPPSAALVVDPRGELVEQLAGDPIERALGELQGNGVRQVLVRDLVDSLEMAANDDRIKAVVLRLDLLEGRGLPLLEAVADAMRKVRDAGKKIVALGDSFDQGQYYLAAHADEIYLNDLGAVFIEGFSYYRMYMKSALDKLRVDLNVFRVGEYKSFVEPFIRDDMSEEDKSASREWLEAMWDDYQSAVVAARGLAPGSLDDYANNAVAHLRAAGGSPSRAALDHKLVDGLMSRQAFRSYMIDLVGESAQGGDFSSIDYCSYLLAARRMRAPDPGSGTVGVIVASGQIVDGKAPPGVIGGDTLAGLIRQAGLDESIAAVVLRVDSPGGSMFASEVVFDEIEDLKATGKPVIVSMGSLAASGGYYISLLADEIWADDSTITGSIGVGALLPTFDRGLDALGLHVDGIGTTKLSGQLRLDRPLGEDARDLLQEAVADAYRIFVSKVAEARGMDYESADRIARGRVWIGSDAKELGLVDALGDLSAAVEAAAKRGNLGEDYGVKYVEPEMSLPARLLQQYSVRFLGNLARLGIKLPGASPFQKLMTTAERHMQALGLWNDPRGLYYLCECGVR